MDLKGKTAFVTGGSGDIGGAIARALAVAGADVAISYLGHVKGAAATVDAVQAAERRSLAVPLDQRDPAAIDAAVPAAFHRRVAASHTTSGQRKTFNATPQPTAAAAPGTRSR